jgi:drug/metabolite transporter (DMT)-like permease
VRGIVGKWFVAVLLTLCVGAYLVEMSGRWDRTIQDANDEAGLVAIVLCVGMALSVAGTLLTRTLLFRRVSELASAQPTRLPHDDRRVALPIASNSPPIRLRI